MIIPRFILILFNILNVYFDAYKIKRALSKNIPISVRHGINFGAYALVTIVLIIVYKPGLWPSIIFAVDAFCNRQITFDIPLNLRRGLKWDYVSTAKPPKAFLDQIEIRIFGYNGRLPIMVYSIGWIVSIILLIWLL